MAIQHPSSRRLVLATVLVAPATVFVAANVLQYGLGIQGAADWFDPLFAVQPVAWILTLLILAGPAGSFLLAASWLLPFRLDETATPGRCGSGCVPTVGRSPSPRSACWWGASSRVT